MRLFFIVSAVLLASGCTKTVEEMSFSEREALSQQIEKRCIAQGTTPGTQRYGSCLQVEAQREIVTRRNAPKVRFNPAGGAAAMQAVSQGYYNAAAASRPVNCRSVRAADGAIRTNCY